MTEEKLIDVLAPVVELLGADGYLLEIEEVSDSPVRLLVRPGPDACADCLVPKDIFRAVVDDQLAKHRASVEFEIAYPND